MHSYVISVSRLFVDILLFSKKEGLSASLIVFWKVWLFGRSVVFPGYSGLLHQ